MGNFNPAILIPIIAVGAPFLIAIVAILTDHQKKMARLMRGMPEEDDTKAVLMTGHKERMARAMKGLPEDSEKVEALEARVQELENRVNELTIALDQKHEPILTNRGHENA